MLGVIRLKGSIKVRGDIVDTLNMLGLKKKNHLAILPRNDAIIGMIKKVENVVTWGELSKELEEQINGDKKLINLKSPKKGFKSLHKYYPKGDLGYRGKAINDLIKRMM